MERGHVLMLLWKCSLWSVRLQSPVRWAEGGRNGVQGALEKPLQHLRIKESSLSSAMIFFECGNKLTFFP